MDRTLRSRQRLRMARGELARVDVAPGSVVRVLRGRVWLTEFGGAQDWSLACGASHAIAGRGVTLVESLAPAIVEVLAPVSRLTLAWEAVSRWLARRAPPARLPE